MGSTPPHLALSVADPAHARGYRSYGKRRPASTIRTGKPQDTRHANGRSLGTRAAAIGSGVSSLPQRLRSGVSSLLGWRRLVIIRHFGTAVAVRHVSQRHALAVHPVIRSADQVRRHGAKMVRPDGGGSRARCETQPAPFGSSLRTRLCCRGSPPKYETRRICRRRREVGLRSSITPASLT